MQGPHLAVEGSSLIALSQFSVPVVGLKFLTNCPLPTDVNKSKIGI